jgi:serine/threonine protein kinase
MSGQVPRTIGERYVLRDELASGGMATVHLGRLIGAAGFSRTVAIKRLHPQFAKEPEFVAMLIDEARIAARIRHPNVVATLDVVSADDELFLVMEFVLGESLSRLTRATGSAPPLPLPAEIAVAIVSGALHGLHAAHEATGERGEWLEVVHRDVSPQNILVGADGLPRVLDFGVAKALGRLQTTHDGQIKGKVAYMAPEQLRGRDVDRRTDVYAASVVLWEALAGRRLFVSNSPGETMARVLEQVVDPPSKLATNISPSLDEVVMRGLKRDPDQRWPSAEEMATALEAVVTLPSQRAIARWVTEAGGERLTRQSRIIARFDGEAFADTPTTRTIEPPKVDPPKIEAASTDAPAPKDVPSQVSISVASEVEPSRREPRRSPWIAVAAGAVISVVGVVSLRSCTHEEKTSAAPAEAAQAMTTTAASASTKIITQPSVAPSPAIVALTSTANSVVAPKKAPPPQPPAPKKKNCNPPYTIDKDGVHIPKKECS